MGWKSKLWRRRNLLNYNLFSYYILMKLILLIFIIAIFSYRNYVNENFSIFNKILREPSNINCEYRKTHPLFKNLDYNKTTIKRSIVSGKRTSYYSKIPSSLIIKNILSTIYYKKSSIKYEDYSPLKHSIYEYSGEIIDKTKVIKAIQHIAKKIIRGISKEINNNLENYKCIKVGYCKPKLISQWLIKMQHYNKKQFKYIVEFEIFVKNKDHSYIFYSEIEEINNVYYINNIKYIGYRFSDLIQLKKPYDKGDKYINIYKGLFNNKYDAAQDYYRNSDENKKLIKEQKFKLEHQNDYRCYGKYAVNKKMCESKTDEFMKPEIKGVWDRKCRSNKECPFYMANKNYKNNRGGCINGVCELPIGLIRRGNRFYSKNTLPRCYNCKSNLSNQCCEEQKNKYLYPNIVTPDYAFSNDFLDRFDQKNNLNEKNLAVI